MTKRKNSCPIPITHKRLNDVFTIWNEVVRAYQYPEDFRTKINIAIQSLRNVTFILQSEKSVFKNFNNWYLPWQEKMKNDDVMKWLHEARNRVVKKGDLETKSIARVNILTYENKKVMELSFSPSSKIEEIAQGIIRFELVKVPAEIKEDVVLSFERRWVVSDFPSKELLEIIAYGYSFLSRLLADAHRELESDIITCEYNQNSQAYSRDGILLEMITTKNKRTLNLTYSNGRIKVMNLHNIREKLVDERGYIKKDIREEVTKRYGDTKALWEKFPKTKDPFPFNLKDRHIEMAKYLLSKDKHLSMKAFLYTIETLSPRICTLLPENKSDKFVLMQEVAEEVKKTNSTGIVIISESWYISAPIDNDMLKHIKKLNQPSKKPFGRKESVIIIMATPEKVETYTIPFSRNLFGKIKFEETLEIKEDNRDGLLRPIFDAWRIMKNR